MNTTDKEIEKLMHDLMRCSVPEPSPGLGNLIMERILKEAPIAPRPVMKVSLKFGLTMPVILISLIIYMVLFVGILFLLQSYQGGPGVMLSGLKEMLPYLLTVTAIAGSLVFFSTLDKILAW